MAQQSYGIWNYILKLMPIPERDEATALIGRTLLATNESLWQEKNALQEILYELHGRNGPSTSSTMALGSPRRPSTASTSSKGNNKRMFQDALVYAKVHYEQDEHHLVFTDHVEELQMLQQRPSFQLEDIMQLRELIQAIIQEESKKLEDLILRLQTLVEGVDTQDDVDIMSLTKSLATTNMFQHANTRGTTSSSSSSIHSNVNSPKKSKHPLLVKKEIDAMEKLKTIPKKLDLKFESDSVNVSIDSTDGWDQKYLSDVMDSQPKHQNNNHSASPSSPKAIQRRKGNSTSRFRERLQDAQAELFLVDDF